MLRTPASAWTPRNCSVHMQTVGRQSLSRSSTMAFALNVSTAPLGGGLETSLWDTFSPFSKLVCIAAINNKAQFEGEGDAVASGGERKVLGDATDAGLMRFCDRVMDVDDVRGAFVSVFSIPFNSRNKWALNMVRVPGDSNSCLVMLKGAPEYVLKKCTHYLWRGAQHDMDEAFSEDMTDAYGSYGTLAQRVIGHAYKVRLCTSCSVTPMSLAGVETDPRAHCLQRCLPVCWRCVRRAPTMQLQLSRLLRLACTSMLFAHTPPFLLSACALAAIADSLTLLKRRSCRRATSPATRRRPRRWASWPATRSVGCYR
jgi:Cation transport ATPase (P-type)